VIDRQHGQQFKADGLKTNRFTDMTKPLRIILILLLAGCNSNSKETPSIPAVTNAPGTISVLAWNVESGGNDSGTIASQFTELAGYDIYCLCEVNSANFRRYTDSLGVGFMSVNSTTGGSDRLQIIFNSNRFELLHQSELHRHDGHTLNNGSLRSPLFLRLRDRHSGIEFIVMVNHLARRDADMRTQQAVGLREWARDQSVPIINVGDFNMDFDFPTQKGNDAFVEMLQDNVWRWVKPTEFIDTNWYDPDGDGKDNFPDSMLDFVFVAGPAKAWNPFPDDDTTSDHRPIELAFKLPAEH
jgi:endonuclease/exonuclease/phosphatase family metal-dependent hydrolase